MLLLLTVSTFLLNVFFVIDLFVFSTPFASFVLKIFVFEVLTKSLVTKLMLFLTYFRLLTSFSFCCCLRNAFVRFYCRDLRDHVLYGCIHVISNILCLTRVYLPSSEYVLR